MINLPKDRCCGCGVCATVCSKSAITLCEDACGYLYPVVDAVKCIDCGLCDTACPELSKPSLAEPMTVYAARCNDTVDFETCASGGAATVFGRFIIRSGGVVYGCAMSNYRTIRHIRIDREEELELIKGSKYVQSDTRHIYPEVKKDLLAGRCVLFTGTPCQVGALRSFLRRPYPNLYTVDLVCHGVPAQAMLRRVIEPEITRCNISPDDATVHFRWKTQFGIQFGIQFGKYDQIYMARRASQDPYMSAFLTGLSYRENCHRCIYAQCKRVSDITIGDFWKLGKAEPSQIASSRGVSLVLVNTPQGEALWRQTASAFTAEIRTLDEAIKTNWNLHDPVRRPAKKDRFLALYRQFGMDYAMRKCDLRYRIKTMAVVRWAYRIPLIDKLLRKLYK